MEKRTMIILILVSTILSLVFTILTYFGVIRYLHLHVSSTEGYIKSYSKLPKASEDTRVVLSFTTTPKGVKRIRPMINSVLNQTVKVDQIALVIPQGTDLDIPDYLGDVVNTFHAGKDYGSGNKLIPILLREKECGTIIIALQDDVVYGKDFVERIVSEGGKHPVSVLTDSRRRALLVKPECYDAKVVDRTKKKYDDSWFLTKAKKAKVISYHENYRRI